MTIKTKSKFITPQLDLISDEAARMALTDLFRQITDFYANVHDDLKNDEIRESDYDNGLFKLHKPLRLTGDGRVIRHVELPAPLWKPGAAAPSKGWEGLFATIDFDKNIQEEINFTVNIPYRWDQSTDISVSVFWLHDANAADAAKFVRWGIEYKAIKAGETVAGAGTSFTQDSAGHDADMGKLIYTEFSTDILASNLEDHDQMAIKLYRDAANDDLNMDARAIMLHLHFTMNELGEAI